MEDDSYREVLKYMKEPHVKLEQEIVSYYLEKMAALNLRVHPEIKERTEEVSTVQGMEMFKTIS